MKPENYTNEELLDFLEEIIRCDTYCPVVCHHSKPEDFGYYETVQEILKRMSDDNRG